MPMYTVEDAFYGNLTLDLDAEAGSVALSGNDIPAVLIRRRADIPGTAPIPIGTRRSEEIEAQIGSRPVTVPPGPGKLRRSTYRVGLIWAQVHYTFAPNSSATTELIRDGQALADFSLGDDGDFIVYWRTIRDRTEPADAAVGYALSAVFGTGAYTLIGMIVSGVTALFPD